MIALLGSFGRGRRRRYERRRGNLTGLAFGWLEDINKGRRGFESVGFDHVFYFPRFWFSELLLVRIELAGFLAEDT